MKHTVFITGVTGFVGSNLAGRLLSAGYRVIGSSTSIGASQPACPIHVLKFGDNVEPMLFRSVVLVHTAFCSGKNQLSSNVDGTKAISRVARAAGIKYEIYLSSYSALADARSDYAQVKKNLENHFRARQTDSDAVATAIVRPGLVIGRGGLFGRISRLIESFPIIPILDGGRQEIPLIAASDLAKSIESLIEKRSGGEFNLFASPAPTLLALLKEFRLQAHARTFFVPFPSSFAQWLLRWIEKTNLEMPIRAENVAGLIANQGGGFPSHLKEFIGTELSLAAMIAEAINSERLAR